MLFRTTNNNLLSYALSISAHFFFSKHSYCVDCVIFSSCVPDSGEEHEKFLVVMQLFSIKSFLQVLQPLKEAFHFCFPVAMSLALTYCLS